MTDQPDADVPATPPTNGPRPNPRPKPRDAQPDDTKPGAPTARASGGSSGEKNAGEKGAGETKQVGGAEKARGAKRAGAKKASAKKAAAKKAPAKKAAAKGKATPAPLAEGEYEVSYIPVSHPVESMAMIIRGHSGAILYTSDTGPTTKLWQAANKTQDLKGMFVELSFPNHMQALADVAGHYTPRTLDAELTKVENRDEIPLFIYHLKPSFYEVTKNELMALQLKNMHLVELTDEFHF